MRRGRWGELGGEGCEGEKGRRTENAAPVSPPLWPRKDTDVNGGPLKSREVDKQPFMEAPHCQGLCSIKRSVCNIKSMFLC